LEHLTQMEQSARAARQIVQDAVIKIDVNRTVQPPVAREMIIRVLRAAGNEGLTRAEIMAGFTPTMVLKCLLIRRRPRYYGCEVQV
jgi:hypothetical protein